MPNDPRLNYGFDEVDYHGITAPGDSSINLPSTGVGGYVVSTSLGLAVTYVNTGTNNPQVGLGSATNPVVGKVKQVELDASVSFQDRGYMTFAYVTGGNQPVPGAGVVVDGTGKVQKISSGAAVNGAYCVGFMVAPGTGTTVCVVRIP